MNSSVEALDPSEVVAEKCPAVMVISTTGKPLDISRLSVAELRQLQWQEECGYGALIAASQSGSERRAQLYSQGYDTVTTILGRIVNRGSGDLVMGYDRRYAALVRQLLARRRRSMGRRPRVFEIGYGSGALLSALNDVDISGIEVSGAMREQACRRLGPRHHDRLYLGDFLTYDLSAEAGADLIFWNDVLEHLVPDQVPDFLHRACRLLAPGGYLVTITPNWHMRPSDITREFHPPRTAAVGFHLKEYTLREVSALLQAAGFERIATPLLVTRGRIWLVGSGLAGLKRSGEPLLEWLPFQKAKLLCRGLGLSCTIARRPLG